MSDHSRALDHNASIQPAADPKQPRQRLSWAGSGGIPVYPASPSACPCGWLSARYWEGVKPVFCLNTRQK